MSQPREEVPKAVEEVAVPAPAAEDATNDVPAPEATTEPAAPAEAPVVEAAPEVAPDAEEDMLLGVSSGEKKPEAVNVDEPAPVAAAVEADDLLMALEDEEKRSATPAFNMADLFGGLFQPPETEVVPDPKLFDYKQMVSELFGVSEDMLNQTGITRADLRRLKEEHQRDADFDDIRLVFGESGLASIRSDALGKNINSVIHATLPPRGDGSNKFLVTMPTVGGCVQTLHAEPKAFSKTEAPPKSTKTEHYTPSNTMRWTVHSNKAYTNTRMILWSDGSRTLHIGPDVFEARPNTETALNMVAADINLEGRNGVAAPGKATALPITDHLVFATPARITNSVNEHLAQASNVVQDVQEMVKLIEGTVAPIGVSKDKNPPKGATAPVEEQYLEELRKAQERTRGKNEITSITQLIENEFENYAQLERSLQDESLSGKLEDIRRQNEERIQAKKLEAEQRRQAKLNQMNNAGMFDAGDGGVAGLEVEDAEDGGLDDIYDAHTKKRSRSAENDNDEDDVLLSKAKKLDPEAWKQKYIESLNIAIQKLNDGGKLDDANQLEEQRSYLTGKAELDEDEWRQELSKIQEEVGTDYYTLPEQ